MILVALFGCVDPCMPAPPVAILSPAPGADGVTVDVLPAFSLDAAPSAEDVRLEDDAGDEVRVTWRTFGFSNGRIFQATPEGPLAVDAAYRLVGAGPDGEPVPLTDFTTGPGAPTPPTIAAIEPRRSTSGSRMIDLVIAGDVGWVDVSDLVFAPDFVRLCDGFTDVGLVGVDGARTVVRLPEAP